MYFVFFNFIFFIVFITQMDLLLLLFFMVNKNLIFHDSQCLDFKEYVPFIPCTYSLKITKGKRSFSF